MNLSSNQNDPASTFEHVFRRLLSNGRKVAAEDAARQVSSPEAYDRRAFGPIVIKLKKDGYIVPAGFRESKTGKHHSGIKRLWVLADSPLGRELLGGYA